MATNPTARQDDIWESIDGRRRVRVIGFEGACVRTETLANGRRNVIDLENLRDPKKYRLVERMTPDATYAVVVERRADWLVQAVVSATSFTPAPASLDDDPPDDPRVRALLRAGSTVLF